MQIMKNCYFSKRYGMEITEATTKISSKSSTLRGCVYINCFPKEAGGRDKRVSLKLTPEECLSVSLGMMRCINDKPVKTVGLIVHQVEGKTAKSCLGVKFFTVNGVEGFNLDFYRETESSDKVNYSFPFKLDSFLHAAKFLEHLSMAMCFEEFESKSESGSEQPQSKGQEKDDDPWSNQPFPANDDDIPF